MQTEIVRAPKIYRIYFTKHFLTGNLKGLSVPTWADTYTPSRYRIGEKGKDIITRDEWVITDASMQKYSRL